MDFYYLNQPFCYKKFQGYILSCQNVEGVHCQKKVDTPVLEFKHSQGLHVHSYKHSFLKSWQLKLSILQTQNMEIITINSDYCYCNQLTKFLMYSLFPKRNCWSSCWIAE